VALLVGCSSKVESVDDSCNAVAEPTNRVPMRVVIGDRPAATGGTVVDGTYESVDRIDYEPKPVSWTTPDTSDRFVVRGDLISTAAREPPDAPTDRRTFRMTFSGTTLLYRVVCPADGSEIEFGYTATRDEIRFYKPPTGPTGYVFVLKRVGP